MTALTRRALLAVFALAAARARAQGFAGLGAGGEGFARPDPAMRLSFPRDHGPHPDFRIEWWYLTANLTGPDGAPYGVQWTLFRQALAPPPQREGWASQQLWMGHAAATSGAAHRFAEKLARGGVGIAGAAAEPFAAWIDDWRLESLGAPFSPLRLVASGKGFAYELTLSTDRPMVLQGVNGYSVKSERGQASDYASQPFFAAEGRLTLDGAEVPVSGRAWMDREWSSQPLDADQQGWDWFSLHLGSGEKVMLFRLRNAGGGDYLSGNWISAAGEAAPLGPEDIALTPLEEAEVAGRRLPIRWTVEVASRGLRVETAPVNRNCWMDTRFAYWEGPIRFSGTHDGVGYLEMTGYAPG